MIGAVIYELSSNNSARLPFVNGRLMHAAFFKILNEFSPSLEKFIHNEMNIKPFTVSFLNPTEKISSVGERWDIRRREKLVWRVTGLNEEILRAASSVPRDYKIQAGALTLSVEKILFDIISVDDFISSVKNSPSSKGIRFDFVSPVSFRIDDFDAPYPRAELIFGSLADKWTQAAMPATVDKKIIRELATQIRLTEWSGQSKKFYLAHDRGTLAFRGRFFYNIEKLDLDIRKVFILLAKFSEFSGVGRLTGQGFGQTHINFS